MEGLDSRAENVPDVTGVEALAFERWGAAELECASKLNVRIKTIQDTSYPAVLNDTLLNDFMECDWKRRG
ncbi:hypothetical protein ILUMI_10219 [Ignelater luminosus]|uniref:Uncharacterized protein n=1 Tax=Ignelater luminosus TaxID=2038154 RepID=A0A8K0D2P2_IGNLU|nr:hypothetical protein ILUMI_10219 [Ignelater luminosus]